MTSASRGYRWNISSWLTGAFNRFSFYECSFSLITLCKVIEDFMEIQNLVCLYNGTGTRCNIRRGTESALDLNFLEVTRGTSEHDPIMIEIGRSLEENETEVQKWSFSSADWEKCRLVSDQEMKKAYFREEGGQRWPGLKSDVVTHCLTVKKNQVIPPAPLCYIPVMAEPFEGLLLLCWVVPKTKAGDPFLPTSMLVASRGHPTAEDHGSSYHSGAVQIIFIVWSAKK